MTNGPSTAFSLSGEREERMATWSKRRSRPETGAGKMMRTRSPAALISGMPEIKAAGDRVRIIFPAPVSGLERLFDQVAILSSRSPDKEKAVLGPFVMASYRPGSEVLLKRNPRYWKRDA